MKKILVLSLLLIMAAGSAVAAVTYSRELYEKAVMGDAESMYQLSLCYMNGLGVAADYDKSDYWLERAAQEGQPNAVAAMSAMRGKTGLSDAKRRELAAEEKQEHERLEKDLAANKAIDNAIQEDGCQDQVLDSENGEEMQWQIPSPPPSDLNRLMKAPTIKTNADGFYFINRDAPNDFPNLRVSIIEFNEGKIYVNDMLLQIVLFNEIPPSDDIKFFDVNFDGYVDIVFGTNDTRDGCVAFLWDSKNKNFVKAEIEIGCNRLSVVNVSKKELYSISSYNAYSNIIYALKWNGKKFKSRDEYLIYFSNLDAAYEQGFKNQYNLLDGDEIIMESNKMSSLPKRWRTIIENIDNSFQ